MRTISDTLKRLKSLQAGQTGSPPAPTHLRAFTSSGSNPGNLKCWVHVPKSAKQGAPLVVVLHGCTQDANRYDLSSGWSRLADRFGFVVLYPEQQRSNNSNLCFNWFSPADAGRGGGEALSIREMIAAVQIEHGTDPNRVFVNGLSAGGAMAAVMLATYPDVFAAGAVIGGLPFGVAHTIPEAFDRMRGHGIPHPDRLPGLVRAASSHSGSWPRLSVWHGSADHTVDQVNASALIEQWRRLHGVPRAPTSSETLHGYTHRVWRNANEQAVVEEYSLAGLGHGTPLDVANSEHGEAAAPFMLDAGVSSTRLIANFWGIAPEQAQASTPSAERAPGSVEKFAAHAAPAPLPRLSEVQRTIEEALRNAGLMKF